MASFTDQPVVLFAMANDDANSLRLAEEERSVRTALADAHDEDRIEFHTLGHTTIDDIYQSVNRFHRRLAIFHYSGHSDSEALQLEDTPAQSQSLSTLLGSEPALQLVFLNGCGNPRTGPYTV